MITTTVTKKDGTTQTWEPSKILTAINKASTNSKESISSTVAEQIIDYVADKLPSSVVSVTDIHKLVENALMHYELFDTAREYISYRQATKPDIFRKRTQYKPFEYPEFAEFRLAILNNFWLHTHYNYNSDIQDLLVNMPPIDAQIAKRAILAISQIEVKVKNFWGRIGTYLPKPEIEEVGAVFAANEVIHAMAYSNLLEIMNLNDEFASLLKVPAIKRRVDFLEKTITTPVDNIEFMQNVVIFSMFIENVSLFSQFYLLLKYHKDHKWLKGTSNAIKATSVEENLHAKFGFLAVNKIRSENPSWWTPELITHTYQTCSNALSVEDEVLSWIMEGADPSYYAEVRNFINYRMNMSLVSIGLDPIYQVDPMYDYTWFDLLINTNSAVDFFDSKSTAYSKGIQTFTEEDLF